MITKRNSAIAVLWACLFLWPQISNAETLGSRFPVVSRGDSVLAEATGIRNESGLDAEADYLSSLWNDRGRVDDIEMDVVADRLTAFARRDKNVRRVLLEKCTSTQLVRLAKKADMENDLSSQKIFTYEYMKREIHDENEPEMLDLAAQATAVLGQQQEKAAQIWDRIAENWPETRWGRKARVYAEAMRGPESIAAIEAAHRLGEIQSRRLENYIAGMRTNHAILEAYGEDFFMSYIMDSDILNADKADMLYIVLTHANWSGEHTLVRELASYIFFLIGYESKLSARAAFAIALSYEMQGREEEAAEAYQDFLRVFPDDSDASRASFNCALSYERSGDITSAMSQYLVTGYLYPGTEWARSADAVYRSHAERMGHGMTAAVDAKKDEHLASLRRTVDPSKIWEAREPHFETRVARAGGSESGDEQAKLRLAKVVGSLMADDEGGLE